MRNISPKQHTKHKEATKPAEIKAETAATLERMRFAYLRHASEGTLVYRRSFGPTARIEFRARTDEMALELLSTKSHNLDISVRTCAGAGEFLPAAAIEHRLPLLITQLTATQGIWRPTHCISEPSCIESSIISSKPHSAATTSCSRQPHTCSG